MQCRFFEKQLASRHIHEIFYGSNYVLLHLQIILTKICPQFQTQSIEEITMKNAFMIIAAEAGRRLHSIPRMGQKAWHPL